MQRQFPTMEELRQRHQQCKKRFDILEVYWTGVKMKIDRADINEPYVHNVSFSSEMEEEIEVYFKQLSDAGFRPFVIRKKRSVISSYCLELRICNPSFGDDDPANPYPEPNCNEKGTPATLKDWFLKYRKDRREGILAAYNSMRDEINKYFDKPVKDVFSVSCYGYRMLAAPRLVKELREEGICIEADSFHEKNTEQDGMSQHTISYFKIILKPQ